MTMQLSDGREAYEVVLRSDLFDRDWYLEQNRGVALSGEDPVSNYLKVGRILGRHPHPRFDLDFYRSAYLDMGGEDPLLHYILKGRAEGRAYSEDHAQDLIRLAEAEWKADHPGVPAPEVGAQRPVISFCIPVMNRLDDIQATLGENLKANSDLKGRVEFILALFGNRDGAVDWVEETYPSEIEEGYLRVLKLDELDGWHFAKAKNVFKVWMRGQIYSSLDGDNFVTREEAEQILEVHRLYGTNFLLHQFSGDFGDGTCGRVSTSRAVYRAVGYDETLLPRQYDEVDLILSTLKRFPALPYLCHDPARNIFSKSRITNAFRRSGNLVNRIIPVDRASHVSPNNPRGDDYVAQNSTYRAMLMFNAHSSFLKNAPGSESRGEYERGVLKARMELVDNLDPSAAVTLLFESGGRAERPDLDRHDTCLFMCCKNDDALLERQVEHYRQRGVRAFFIVDDHSDRCVDEVLTGDDIWVFRPKVGRFLTAKALWLSGLMKAYVPAGAWVLTADADEFVDLPAGFETFGDLARSCEAQKLDLVPGLMLDMLPRVGAGVDDVRVGEGRYPDLFDEVAWVTGRPDPAYCEHHSVDWGFGRHCRLSWAVDARYHSFGTFDSLRKVPFFRTRAHRHLNQGFHTLHYNDGTKPPGAEIWERKQVLSVRHYKLAKMVAGPGMAAAGVEAAYHARTAKNIQKLSAATPEDMLARLSDLPRIAYSEWGDPALRAAELARME